MQTPNLKDCATPTQLFYAKNGVITPQMEAVAKTECLEAEFIRAQIAQGKLIIPANINHKNLVPMGIGRALKCKINANIGSSSLSSGIDEEIEKLRLSIKYGADTVMDLSTGGIWTKFAARLSQTQPFLSAQCRFIKLSMTSKI